MSNIVDLLKQMFFFAGSTAGLIAFVSHFFETKLKHDIDQVENIKKLINEKALIENEKALIELELTINADKKVYESDFDSIDQLLGQVQTKQEGVRFIGPSSNLLTRQLVSFLNEYLLLKNTLKSPHWAYKEKVNNIYYWELDRSSFESDYEYSSFAYHTAIILNKMRNAYIRFRLISELHPYEIPFSRWLLPRRIEDNCVTPFPNVINRLIS